MDSDRDEVYGLVGSVWGKCTACVRVKQLTVVEPAEASVILVLIREGCKLKPPSVPPHSARRRSDRTQRPPIRYKAPTNPACSKVTRLATPRPINRPLSVSNTRFSAVFTDRPSHFWGSQTRRMAVGHGVQHARAAPNPRLQPMGHNCGRRHASLCHVRR
jgi:hypothetical protein